MTKPIPDKAEITLEFPDKLYLGSFGRSSRFDARLDNTGVSLVFDCPGDAETRKSVHIHIRFELFADILRTLAETVPGLPAAADCKDLREAASVLCQALVAVSAVEDAPPMSEEEGELILRLME
jgi:hypothetical protein